MSRCFCDEFCYDKALGTFCVHISFNFRVVCDYMNDNIKYVVSDKDWDGTFDEASSFLETNSRVCRIFACVQ